MAQRETIQNKPFQSLTLGSVNERVQGTEIPDNEWSSVTGTFPEFTGLQARIWGKRLLAKYSFPIMGIHQFWTPLGYAGGIYQFTGTVDFGKWITQTTKLDLSLPGSTNFDGGGFSLDDFGYEFGRSFTVSTPNVCSFNFNEFLATHQYCGETIKGSNLPDDSNGGPAGQGKKCKWHVTTTDYTLNAFIVQQQKGTGGTTTATPVAISASTFVPNPVPAPPAPTFTYAPASPIASSPQCIISRIGSGIVLTPTTGQMFTDNSSSNYQTYLDLTSLLSVVAGNEGSASVTLGITTVNNNGTANIDVPIAVAWDDPESYENVFIDLQNYLPSPVTQSTGGGNPFGETIIYSAQVTSFSIHIRTKVCS